MDRCGEGGSAGLARHRGKRDYTEGEEEMNNKDEDAGRGWGAEGRKGEDEMKNIDTKHCNTQDIKGIIINNLSL